jgi:hypothetical protein
MPTDFSTLGFPVETLKDLAKVASKVVPLSTESAHPRGSSCAGLREAGRSSGSRSTNGTKCSV